MTEKRTLKLDGLNSILIAMTVIMVILFLPAIIFAIAGNPIGVAVSLTAIGMLFFGILIMGSFALGAAYARSSTREGAGMVLSALNFDNKADAAMMAQTTRIFAEGVRAARSLHSPEMPALPFPSQGIDDWMPSVSVLDTGEGWE